MHFVGNVVNILVKLGEKLEGLLLVEVGEHIEDILGSYGDK